MLRGLTTSTISSTDLAAAVDWYAGVLGRERWRDVRPVLSGDSRIADERDRFHGSIRRSLR
jgi:catechol 2,3-dioxygenase-like lactoylglutathione lyase family enzyme